MNTKLVNHKRCLDEAKTNLGSSEDSPLHYSDFYVTFLSQMCLPFLTKFEMDNWKVGLKQQIL